MTVINLRHDAPFVSIVLPCYNAKATIGDCLSSLEAQTFPIDRFEIIVADNNSTDGSVAMIAAKYPRVIVVSATQKGSGYARNAGIAQAKGQLLLSIDSDCVADEMWISSMVSAFASAPERTGAIGGLIKPHSTGTLVEQYEEAWISQPKKTDESGIQYTATPNAAFLTEALREVGGFDGTLGFDDTDLGIRLNNAGYGILYTDAAVVYHRNPVTIYELFRHRVKYGQFSFSLARKHPSRLGDPRGAAKRRSLFFETLWRITKDLLKCPFSIVPISSGKPFGWPIIDALIAWGNYSGFRKASLAEDRESSRA